MTCFCAPPSMRLAAKRARRGMTLKQVAQQMGVSVTTVWSWEAGRPIPEKRLEQIAKVLNTSSTYIRTGSNYSDPDFWSLVAAGSVDGQVSKSELQAPNDERVAARRTSGAKPSPKAKQPTTPDFSKRAQFWRQLIAQDAGVDISRVEVVIRHV